MLGNYSVLIIDDEIMICKGIAQMLDWEKLGFYEIDIATSVPEAMEIISRRPYTLMIVDVRIHDKLGLDVIKAAKVSGSCRNFIVISAYREFGYAQRAIDYGVQKYLLKPINRFRLQESVEEILVGLSEGERRRGEPAWMNGLPKEARYQRKIIELLHYVDRNYADQRLSLSRAGEILHINPSYLGQLFFRTTGMRFSDYLNQYRLSKAIDLIVESDMMIYEVSQRCGFSNSSWFYRLFRRYTSLTAEEYRQAAVRGEDVPPVYAPFVK